MKEADTPWDSLFFSAITFESQVRPYFCVDALILFHLVFILVVFGLHWWWYGRVTAHPLVAQSNSQ